MIVLVTFGGIVGTRIAPSPALATLPLALAVTSVALTTFPAAMLAQRIGRKRALIVGAFAGVGGAFICAWSTAAGDFLAFCAGGALLGAHATFVLQYRFAAVEYVPIEEAGRAIATVMLGTLGAAVLGPAAGDAARLAFGWPEFTGSFVALAVLCLAGAALLTLLDSTHERAVASRAASRPLRQIASQPAFKVAVLASVTSYAAMSFIMTATPISMHVLDHLSVTQTRHVITAHLLGMYLPSLVSGWLTRTLGVARMMLLGIAAMGVCVAIATVLDRHFAHYLSGLILLGVGWNLLFVAGTTLLTRTYEPAERFKVQGVNDLATFGVQAVVSLLAGAVVVGWGWSRLNALSIPLLLATAAAVVWLQQRERAVAVPSRPI